jgi:putative DNA primase/helicase
VSDPTDYFVQSKSGRLSDLKVLTLAEDAEEPFGRVRSGPDGGLYRYDDGVYRDDGEQVIRQRADALLGYLTKNARVTEVVHHFENRESADPLAFDPPRGPVVYAANGILHLGRDWSNPVLSVEPYTPENAWLARVPWDYDPTAPPPTRILGFLREVFVRWDGQRWVSDDDTIRYVLALIGLAMVPRNVLRRAVLLHGKGRNGKSILLHYIRGLLGPENVSAVSLEALGNNRFAAAELRGKLANVCGDISDTAGRDSSLFKQMTGDDPIYGERKFGQPFTFSCGAMPFWSCNVYPRSPDVTPAYMNRWSVIHFERQFEENAATEAELKGHAEDATEMRGLLALSIQNAVWLLAQDKPTTDAVPTAMREAKRRFQENADTVRAFVDEAMVRTPTGRIEGKQAYGWYASFCDAAGMGRLGRNKFYERLEAIEGVERGPKSGNKLHFVGVELDETWTAGSGVQEPQELADLFVAVHSGE